MRRVLSVAILFVAAALLTGCGLFSVSPEPTTEVNFTYAVDELRVSVVAQVTLPRATEIQVLWYWGDGETSQGGTAQHVYAEPGLYEITMRVLARFPESGAGAPPGHESLQEREYTVTKVVQVERRFDLVLQGEPLPGAWPALPKDRFYSGQLIYFYLVTKETVAHVVWYFWHISNGQNVLIDSVTDLLVVARYFPAGSCGSRDCYTYAVTCSVTNADGTATATLRKEFYVCPPP